MWSWMLFLFNRAHQEKTRRMVLHKGIACQAIRPLGHQHSRLTALASHQSRRLHQQVHQVQLSLKLVSINLQSYSTIVMLDCLGVVACKGFFRYGKCKTEFVEINPSPVRWTATIPACLISYPFWMPPSFIAFDDVIKSTNHRKGDVIQTNRLLFATWAGISRNHHKAHIFKETTASDECRLCRYNLKQKFGDFFKNSYMTAVNVFKPWTRGGRQMSVQ